MVANINSSVPLCRHSVCVCVYEFPFIVWLYGWCSHRICFEFIFRSIQWQIAVFFLIHFANDNQPFGLVRVGMT